MTITAGTTVPSIDIHTKTKEGLDTINTAKYCAGRKVVLFCVPGAFTLPVQQNICQDLLKNLIS